MSLKDFCLNCMYGSVFSISSQQPGSCRGASTETGSGEHLAGGIFSKTCINYKGCLCCVYKFRHNCESFNV